MTESSWTAPLPDQCDFLVVGAGPAGLATALHLGRSRAGSVVLLDRRDPWREPVACGEGVRLSTFEAASPLDVTPWIRGKITRCRLGSPGASFVWESAEHPGAIIDRAAMHRDLAEASRTQGVLCHFRARATGLSGLVDGFRTLDLEAPEPMRLRARCVIDATGPGAGLGKSESIVRGDADLEPAIFTFVTSPDFDPQAIELWYSATMAPGGYAWVFPSGPDRANVGIVNGRHTQPGVRECLRQFLDFRFPGAATSGTFGGAIPCTRGKAPLARELLIKAGDAASMAHPLGRSGIVEALESGRMAAQCAIEATSLASESERKAAYARYRKAWQARRGTNHDWTARIKPWIAAVDDRTWRGVFADLDAIPRGGHTWPRVARTVLAHLPGWIFRRLRA